MGRIEQGFLLDCLLVAQAFLERLSLVTADRTLQGYGDGVRWAAAHPRARSSATRASTCSRMAVSRGCSVLPWSRKKAMGSRTSTTQ